MIYVCMQYVKIIPILLALVLRFFLFVCLFLIAIGVTMLTLIFWVVRRVSNTELVLFVQSYWKILEATKAWE